MNVSADGIAGAPTRTYATVARKYAALREQPFRSITEPNLLRRSGRFAALRSFVILDLLLLSTHKSKIISSIVRIEGRTHDDTEFDPGGS